ncbi:glycosyltransferase family 4 protein [Desulfogranum japonicum]|uniref:glycosyltransferase family 4 protein n=1 Tax=Desulfogranum japonicum TaxID=231447 RepID=UPI000421C783|nr:glycosyltransferase family 4 protein [Desulfogranum japonicum]
MAERKRKDICILYAAGPGDVVKTFQAWDSGVDDPHQVAVTYSGQFFQVCRELGVRGVAVSFNPRADILKNDQFVVENRPKGAMASGISYHRQQLAYAKGLIQIAAKEGADVLVAAESTGHLFSLGWYAPPQLALIPTIHCTLWPKFKPLDTKQRILNFFNRSLFTRRALGILCISEDIRRQLQLIGGSRLRPVHRFRPCYRRETFESVPMPVHDSDTFHILFAGRLETNKGIFDLIEICTRLKAAIKNKVIWDIAGDGSQEGKLRQMVADRGIGHIFRVHGYCHRPKMLELIRHSHAFIVPTRSDFEEGFNKVVAESILNNRPVLTSAVCPAIDDVRPAVVEARPDNVDDYRLGVERLVEDSVFYQDKLSACQRVQQQFYDQENSWRAKMKLAVEGIL